MADPRTDQLGAVFVPPTTVSTDGQSLAATCDPVLDAFLTAFKTILRTKLDATWAKAAKGLSSHVVVGTYPYEPIRPVAAVTWDWPALFMWRQKERYFRRTQFWNDVEHTGKLSYILPPLPLEFLIKLQPIRVAVRTVLTEFIEHYGDPSYLSGANVIATNALESFGFAEATYGVLPADSDLELYHPVLDMTWVMRERETAVSTQYTDLSTIESATWIEDESGGAGETLLVEDSYDATIE